MALLGAQLVITLVMVSVIQKIGPYFSFAKWLLCSTGLIRYLYPTNDELKQLARIPKEKTRNKKTNKNGYHGKNNFETFHIERSLEVTLETAKITYADVIHLKFFAEYQWLIDFSLYAAVVYVATEIYQIWYSLGEEINLSLIWCFVVFLFALKILLSLTIQYFKGDESGERSVCIIMGLIYLLTAMMILIIDERILELGLENAYSNFNQTASIFLSKQKLTSSGPASKIFIKFCIAVWCALIGAFLTFPGMRIAKMHWDLLKYYQGDKVKQLLLNLSFALPFLLVILWVKPITKDYLTIRIFSGRTEPLMTVECFEVLRVVAVISTMLIKIFLLPLYLQTYLDLAYYKTEDLKKEAGRITNIEYQKKVASVFQYLCVVALQYLIPLLLCIYLTFMYKSLGDYKWNWLYNSNEFQINANESVKNISSVDSIDEVYFTWKNIKSIFNVELNKGIFGFTTWWCCFTYFTTTSIGLIYQSRFSID